MKTHDIETVELETLDLNTVEPMKVELHDGLKNKHREKIAGELSRFLANSYLFMLKLHNFHWNTRGPLFKSVHEMTEEQYENVFDAIDEIAERIRALGYLAAGTIKEYEQLRMIDDGDATISQTQMVAQLVKDHETIVKLARKTGEVAGEYGDEATLDLMTQRMENHEKFAWMLRSLLEK